MQTNLNVVANNLMHCLLHKLIASPGLAQKVGAVLLVFVLRDLRMG